MKKLFLLFIGLICIDSVFAYTNYKYVYGIYYNNKIKDTATVVYWQTSSINSRMETLYIDGAERTVFRRDNTISNYSHMFGKQPDITTVIIHKSFAQAQVTSMRKWFFTMENLETILGIDNLNTENVTDMDSMFSDCSSLANLDLSNFNTENVTNMKGMFSDCSSLKSLDLSSFNTENVTDMRGMFSGCGSLKKLDLRNINTEKVTNSYYMFEGCDSLKEINVGSNDFKNQSYFFDGVGSESNPCDLYV